MKNFTLLGLLLSFALSALAQWTSLNSGTTMNLSVINFNQGSLFTAGKGAPPASVPGSIFKSDNGGNTWFNVANNSSGFTDISFLTINHGIAIPRKKDSIFRTTDAGNNWQREYSPNCFGGSYGFPDVYFTDSMTGYSPGFKTTDAGATWVLQNGALNSFPYTPSAITFINDSTGIVAGNNYWGQNYKTTNRGINWTPVNVPFHSWEILSMHMADAQTGYCTGIKYATVQEAEILKTTDSGNNWTSIYTTPLTSLLLSVFCTDTSICYAVGTKGTILKTINGGTTWTSQYSGTMKTLSKILFTDANTGYIVGDSGVILKTTNAGGATGIDDYAPLVKYLSIYPNPAKDIMMVKSGTEVLRITICSLDGKILIDENYLPGNFNQSIGLEGITRGIYIVTILTVEGIQKIKLLKE
jgi:photosystem II stability/assembly factor-like uncharacterized protein